jgi:hypothetical protein
MATGKPTPAATRAASPRATPASRDRKLRSIEDRRDTVFGQHARAWRDVPRERAGWRDAPDAQLARAIEADEMSEHTRRARVLGKHEDAARREQRRRALGHRLPRDQHRFVSVRANFIDHQDQLGCETVEARREEEPRVGLVGRGEARERRGHVGAMLGHRHHARREIDGIGHRRKRRDQRAQLRLRRFAQRRHREARALALVGAHHAAAAAERRDEHARSLRPLRGRHRAQLQAYVEQLFARMDTNHRELAAQRVEGAVAAREAARVRERSTSGRGGRAAFHHDHRLAAVARQRERVDEGVGIGQAFGVHRDDARAVVVDQRTNENPRGRAPLRCRSSRSRESRGRIPPRARAP